MSSTYVLFAATEEQVRLACAGWGAVDARPSKTMQFDPIQLKSVERLSYSGSVPGDQVHGFPVESFERNLDLHQSIEQTFKGYVGRPLSPEEFAELNRPAYLPDRESIQEVLRVPDFFVQAARESEVPELAEVSEFCREHEPPFFVFGIG